MTYQTFVFDDYSFDAITRTVSLHYAIDEAFHFTETYTFNFPFTTYDEAVLDRAIQNLFFMAGVSYYKTFLPAEIVVKAGQLDQQTAQFFGNVWQKGLGEFFYVNGLDPRTTISFPFTATNRDQLTANAHGKLIGIGGGKDSLVSVELLRNKPDVATWSSDHQSQLTPLIDRVGLAHYWVERTFDPQLLELKDRSDVYNGHVPISAIWACLGTVVAVLSGKQDVITSNESSADEETLTYQGVSINHQYSKTSDFERSYQAQLERDFGTSLRYYSFLRPLSELRISEVFAHIGLDKYHDVFSSCNRAFTQDQNHMSWCGTCPKCAFVFLALTPFVDRPRLEALFGDKNLLLSTELELTYRQLLGIEGDKPLECVGEVKESRMAMRMAQRQYPELSMYTFELPETYDYKQLSPHQMPADVYEFFTKQLSFVA